MRDAVFLAPVGRFADPERLIKLARKIEIVTTGPPD